MQGGNIAASSAYVKAKTKFAKEVAFNKKITTWVDSYDGRNQEPEVLPVKFPIFMFCPETFLFTLDLIIRRILPNFYYFVNICKYK